MKSKNRRNIVYAMLFCGTLGIVLLGIFLPGQVLMLQSRFGLDAVAAVPEQYFPAASAAVARNASANLSVYERIQLIEGTWESEVTDAASYEMELQNFDAIAVARKSMKKLFDIGLYPADLSEGYGNWYTWEAQARKAVDATFYTYTAYFWEIRFEKYNGEERHTVYLLEDGTVFWAYADLKNGFTETQPDDIVRNLREEEGVETISQNWEQEVLADWIPFSDMETEGLKWKNLMQIEQGEESCFVLQAASDTQYLYAVTPQRSTGKSDTMQ